MQYLEVGESGPPLPCSVNADDAESRVRTTEENMMTWTNKYEVLYRKYSWLLFFRVPKMLRLYHLISSCDYSIESIVHETNFLFVNDTETRKRMKEQVQV